MTRRDLFRVAGLSGICVALLAWSAPGQVGQTTDFATLFAEYRGTGADRAVREFAAWPIDRIEREATLNTSSSDPWITAAETLFHLEASQAARLDDRDWLSSAHVSTARRLIASALPEAQRAGNTELTRFYRDWLLVNAATLRQVWLGGAYSDSITMRLDDDAEIQMLMGASAAVAMGPRLKGHESTFPQPFGIIRGKIESQERDRQTIANGEDYNDAAVRVAETAFRKALAIDPSLVEARVRLGRVLQQTNRTRDGRRELERASVEASAPGDAWTGYLADLFLGQLHEDEERLPEAERAYAHAIARFPTGVSARLALGQVLMRMGRSGEGSAISLTIFRGDAQPAQPDPWSMYTGPNYWQGGKRLPAMRARVSKTPFISPVASAAPESSAPMEPRAATSSPSPVRLDVLATDGDGQPIRNLTADDFLVIDNSVKQLVDARSATTLSVALVLDTSASMGRNTVWHQLQESVEAVRRALAPGDVVSVVTASDRLALRADRLRNPQQLTGILAGLEPEPRSQSAIFDGVFAAGALVVDGPGRPVVIVVSDGFDNASWFRRRLAIARLPTLGAIVDGISIPMGDEGDWQEDVAFGDINLREPTDRAGGIAFRVSEPALARDIAGRFATLRQSYTLTYTPAHTPTPANGWHEITVTLRPGLKGKVQVAPGYYAPTVK